MIDHFKIRELELWWTGSPPYPAKYVLSFYMRKQPLPYYPQGFDTYEEGIGYIYNKVQNNEIELSLESYLALIKEIKRYEIGV